MPTRMLSIFYPILICIAIFNHTFAKEETLQISYPVDEIRSFRLDKSHTSPFQNRKEELITRLKQNVDLGTPIPDHAIKLQGRSLIIEANATQHINILKSIGIHNIDAKELKKTQPFNAFDLSLIRKHYNKNRYRKVALELFCTVQKTNLTNKANTKIRYYSDIKNVHLGNLGTLGNVSMNLEPIFSKSELESISSKLPSSFHLAGSFLANINYDKSIDIKLNIKSPHLGEAQTELGLINGALIPVFNYAIEDENRHYSVTWEIRANTQIPNFVKHITPQPEKQKVISTADIKGQAKINELKKKYKEISEESLRLASKVTNTSKSKGPYKTLLNNVEFLADKTTKLNRFFQNAGVDIKSHPNSFIFYDLSQIISYLPKPEAIKLKGVMDRYNNTQQSRISITEEQLHNGKTSQFSSSVTILSGKPASVSPGEISILSEHLDKEILFPPLHLEATTEVEYDDMITSLIHASSRKRKLNRAYNSEVSLYPGASLDFAHCQWDEIYCKISIKSDLLSPTGKLRSKGNILNAKNQNIETRFMPLSRGTYLRMMHKIGKLYESGPRDPFKDPFDEDPFSEEDTTGGALNNLKIFFQKEGISLDVPKHMIAYDGSQIIATATIENLIKMESILRQYNDHIHGHSNITFIKEDKEYSASIIAASGKLGQVTFELNEYKKNEPNLRIHHEASIDGETDLSPLDRIRNIITDHDCKTYLRPSKKAYIDIVSKKSEHKNNQSIDSNSKFEFTTLREIVPAQKILPGKEYPLKPNPPTSPQ